MKRILILLSCSTITLASSHVLPSDTADTSLHIRDSGYLSGRSTSLGRELERLKPRSDLQRRGKKKATDRIAGLKSQNRGRPNPKASIHAEGRAEITVFNPTAPGQVEDVQERLLTSRQRESLHTQHRVAAAAMGRHLGPTPPDAHQQPISEHPLKAESQGRLAIGSITVPPGGRGHMRKETPAGVQDINVPGGETFDDVAMSASSDANKLSVSVTSGGKVQAGAHSSFDTFTHFAENFRPS